MNGISQIDQAIIVLRERLRQMRSQRSGSASASNRVTVRSRTPQPIDQLRTILSIDGVPPRDMRRAIIRSLLSEAFGEAVSNDLSFQAVADQVTTMLESDPETAALLDQATDQIRRGK